MSDGWGNKVKTFRLRHGLSQQRMAAIMGVSQRTVSRWERGEDSPSLAQQKRLRDLGWEPPGTLLDRLPASIVHCPAPRALSRTPRLQLQMLSLPAIEKRPSIVNWIGRDLAPIASGVLQEMLDDRDLQKSIARMEISSVVCITQSVLRTPESTRIGKFRTTITYFFHKRTLYSDAISFPVGGTEPLGYAAIPMDAIAPGPQRDKRSVEIETGAARQFMARHRRGSR